MSNEKLQYLIKLFDTGTVQPFAPAILSGLPAGDTGLNDLLLDYNNTINQSVTVSRMHGFGSPKTFDFRLTTQSGVAVSTSDRTSQGTLYLTPCSNIGGTTAGSARLALYDGTRWKLYTSGELSISLSAGAGI